MGGGAITEPNADTSGLRIFLVENHEDTLKYLALHLQLGGHDVRCARTAAEAIRELAHAACDVLIADIGLPDGSGRDVLRALGSPPDVYAIAMSGYAAAGEIAKSEAIGFRHHLVKPIHPERLDALLVEAAREKAAGPREAGASSGRRPHEAVEQILEAHDAERRWLTKTLHDGVCQDIGAARLVVSAVSRRIGAAHPEASVLLAELERVLDRGASDLARLHGWLSVAEPAGRSLAAALTDLADRVSKTLPCEVVIAGVGSAGPTADDQLVRLAYDALVGILRRGASERVSLSLSVVQEELILRIEEHVADPCADAGDALLEARARLLGAVLTIDREAGRGMRITCRVGRAQNA